MNLLITGGAGFIGSNMVRYELINHPEDKITVLDKLTYAGSLENLDGVLDKITFIKGDIADREAVFDAFAETKPDIVINFAAESHVDRSIENPEIFLKTNIIGTQTLMDACREYGITRFHQISTDEVYGDLPLDRPDLKFTEISPLKPSSPYSASKAAADLLVMSYHRTYQLPVTISRCSNNYGKCQFPEKLIPLMVKNAMSDKPLPVYGTGQNIRDWIYVTDHCRAVDMIIRNGRAGEIYNVGGNCERANIDIVRAILKIFGKSDDLIECVADRKGHDLRYAIDSSKLEAELGWTAQTDFDEGFRETVEWYRDNN